MKVSYAMMYLPKNTAEEAAVPVGALVIKTGETEVKLKSASGIESVATSSTVSSAVATVAIKDWQANSAVALDEMRRATLAAGNIEAGDLIRSNSARTTGATFDATEAGNWTEFSPDIVTSVAGRTGAVVLAKADVGLSVVDNTADTAKPVSTAQQTALDGKSATTHAHTGTYEPANANIQSHVTAAHAPSTAEQNVNADWNAASGDAQILNKPTVAALEGTTTPAMDGTAAVGTAATASKSDHKHPSDTSRQAELVSGTNIKTVNGASVLGSGNVSVAADLPGGVASTAYDDGLDAGNAVIDRATVAGQTILKYQTPGSSTFKVPVGITSIDYLIVAGGGGGGKSIGAGGGAGGLLTATGYTVTPGATLAISVGAGGAGATTTTAVGVNGANSVLGAITPAAGGGGGTGQSVGYPTGPGGSAGGSGGGGARNNTTGGAATPSGQGFAGGSGSNAGDAYGAGGGGGAGAIGGNGSGTAGGNGGVGFSSSITGTPAFYAGGGGGGVNTGTPGLGGSGVGGNAGTGGSPGGSGVANTGGGGGGSESTANAGSGGSGIVVVRFSTQTRSYQALQSYADNAAAIAGGRLVGEFFRNTASGATQQVT